jgi:hypothetical protein
MIKSSKKLSLRAFRRIGDIEPFASSSTPSIHERLRQVGDIACRS